MTDNKNKNFWNIMGYSDEEWEQRKRFETQFNPMYELGSMYEEDLEMIG